MQTRDEVEGLHNCREFSQRLECLYQAMQTQEKVFYCFYKINFPRKKRKTLYTVLIKREILTSRKVLSTKSFTRNSVLVLQKDAFILSEKKLSHFLCNDFPSFSRQRNGQIKKTCRDLNLKTFSNSCLRD